MPARGQRADDTDIQMLADLLRRVRRLEKRVSLVENVNEVTTSGSAQTIPDVGVTTMNKITLTANCTLTFPDPIQGAAFTLKLIQDGTGSRTVTWPSSSVRRFAAGTAPTLSTAAGAIDSFAVVCDDGSKWDVYFAGKGMA